MSYILTTGAVATAVACSSPTLLGAAIVMSCMLTLWRIVPNFSTQEVISRGSDLPGCGAQQV